MAFRNNNAAFGLAADAQFQIGVSDVDQDYPGTNETNVLFPYPSDPAASWVYYECNVECRLDSGIVVHNRLPQVDSAPDTLATCDYADPNLAKLTGGVNLKSRDQYTDIVQRMGHSRYWFRLWGQAMRVGLQVPIPSIKVIGGVPAIPYDKNPQWAFNRIAPGGNYGGVILWHAAWSLWYTTAVPPRGGNIPAADPAALITDGNAPRPKGIQIPFTAPDDNAVKFAPTTAAGTGGKFPGAAGPR